MISIVLCMQNGSIVDSLSRPQIFGIFEVKQESLEPRTSLGLAKKRLPSLNPS